MAQTTRRQKTPAQQLKAMQAAVNRIETRRNAGKFLKIPVGELGSRVDFNGQAATALGKGSSLVQMSSAENLLSGKNAGAYAGTVFNTRYMVLGTPAYIMHWAQSDLGQAASEVQGALAAPEENFRIEDVAAGTYQDLAEQYKAQVKATREAKAVGKETSDREKDLHYALMHVYAQIARQKKESAGTGGRTGGFLSGAASPTGAWNVSTLKSDSSKETGYAGHAAKYQVKRGAKTVAQVGNTDLYSSNEQGAVWGLYLRGYRDDDGNLNEEGQRQLEAWRRNKASLTAANQSAQAPQTVPVVPLRGAGLPQ